MPLFQKSPAPKRRRKKTPSAPPAPKVEAPSDYEKNAQTFFRGAAADVSENKCDLAFEKLLNGVSYAGMAEAEAKRAGKTGSEFAKQTFEAVKQFKLTCRVK